MSTALYFWNIQLLAQQRPKFFNDIISKIYRKGARLVRKNFLIVLLVGFVVYAGFNLTQNVTPYVSIAEARASSNSVQVKGLLDKNFQPIQRGDKFNFSLQDEQTGETMPVIFDGIKPDQFDEAYHIVAIGKFQSADNSFHAKKLLIKCPSKYESQKPR